ncbi:MAG: hypothetical protein M3Y48_13565 [Actinomycetota bacterium]|nr:hypothetical protein [Actinomycetota bacterium]
MTLDRRVAARIDARLAVDDAARQDRYPGAAAQRQPVHTVYVPADQFTAGIVGEWGAAALAALDAHGQLPSADGGRDDDVDALVRAKLATEPIEDLRIDFEDGYGGPSDDVEDADARAAARALARGVADGVAPRFTGIRMKSLESSSRRRGIRTLDLFLDTLLGVGPLPAGFRSPCPRSPRSAKLRRWSSCVARSTPSTGCPRCASSCRWRPRRRSSARTGRCWSRE